MNISLNDCSFAIVRPGDVIDFLKDSIYTYPETNELIVSFVNYAASMSNYQGKYIDNTFFRTYKIRNSEYYFNCSVLLDFLLEIKEKFIKQFNLDEYKTYELKRFLNHMTSLA